MNGSSLAGSWYCTCAGRGFQGKVSQSNQILNVPMRGKKHIYIGKVNGRPAVICADCGAKCITAERWHELNRRANERAAIDRRNYEKMQRRRQIEGYDAYEILPVKKRSIANQLFSDDDLDLL